MSYPHTTATYVCVENMYMDTYPHCNVHVSVCGTASMGNSRQEIDSLPIVYTSIGWLFIMPVEYHPVGR